MKKLLFGLLIIAAAAGAFFYLRNEKKPTSANKLDKQQILGKWKLETIHPVNDSSSGLIALIPLIDSNISNFRFEFTPDGSIIQTVNGTIDNDTASYEWKGDQLAIREGRLDTIPDLLTVLALNKDSLYFQSQDSVLMLFSKAK